MRSLLSRGADHLFHPVRQRRGGDVNNLLRHLSPRRRGDDKKRGKVFFFPRPCEFVNLITWTCWDINVLIWAFISPTIILTHSSLASCFLASFLSHCEHFQSVQPLHLAMTEFDKATIAPHPPPLTNYMAKGKGHLFVTKCLSHSFTWQQSSTSFPTVKCQIWKPSIRLMFRVRLRATFNPEAILQ